MTACETFGTPTSIKLNQLSYEMGFYNIVLIVFFQTFKYINVIGGGLVGSGGGLGCSMV